MKSSLDARVECCNRLSPTAVRAKRQKTLVGLLFASPWIIGFLLFSLYPICTSFYYSFTEFNLFTSPQWVGMDNFTELFNDEKFYKSLYNTLYMVIFATPASIVFSLLLAVLLNQSVKGMSVYRTLFYLPSIVPTVATSLLWLWILNPRTGLINSCLRMIGLPQPNWLMDLNWTKPSLILIAMWSVGSMMVIFLAALQDVPRSLHEAADLDGAGPIRKFFSITLPCISPVIFFQLIMNIIYYFQYFTQAYLIISGSSSGSGLNGASGGVENSMLFYSIYLFHNAFYFFKMGKASAMAWILFVIVMIVTWLLFRTQSRWVSYGDE
ncbi:MAG: sugar ABC transporter permease [Clostridia bacterium]